MNKLALYGGRKTIEVDFADFKTIGLEEKNAAIEVINSGSLSAYYGSHGPQFLGGEKVKQFEHDICNFFNVKHAITVNSWTSGLVCAVGALGLEPGDEIIVPTWTMCASATAILHWNCIPVFADIDKDTFNVCVDSIVKNISSRTKAILCVDIFGQCADYDSIMSIAKKYNLKVISDTAQSPAAKHNDRYAGTLSDIGGFSLNYHKHFHTGEGGIIVTDNDDYALKMRLIRNHAEAVVKHVSDISLKNMIGGNYRLGEIECAIGIEQLKKLPRFVNSRQRAAEQLSHGLKNLKGLILPKINTGNTHVYYVFGMRLDMNIVDVSRDLIVDALKAEGVPGVMNSYTLTHMLPVYQNKICYGSKGLPWSLTKNNVSYDYGICPNAEQLNKNEFFGLEMCMKEFNSDEIDLVIQSFQKVWEYFKIN